MSDQLLADITAALNWASIDSLANTPDFELAEKIIGAPSLAGYRKVEDLAAKAEAECRANADSGDFDTTPVQAARWLRKAATR